MLDETGMKEMISLLPCLRVTALHLDPQVTVFHLYHHNYSFTESCIPSSVREINGRRKVNHTDLVFFSQQRRNQESKTHNCNTDLRWCCSGFCCHLPKYT